MQVKLVCSTILDLIPKYDVPRYSLSILHRQKEWLENAGEETEYPTLENIGEEIDELEDYIDYGRMSSEEFMGKYSKFLKFDPIRPMLYGNGYEIRGSQIIAMEDIRYDTYSFDTLEDIEAVYNEIKELSGSLLRRES